MIGLAGAIGISRATLYRYFPNRAELIKNIALQSIEDTSTATNGIYVGVHSYREAFSRMIDALLPLGASYHFLSREFAALGDPEVFEATKKQDEEFFALIDEAKGAGEIDSTLPTRWIARHFDGVLWLAWTELAEGYVASRDAPKLAFRTFWGGICSE